MNLRPITLKEANVFVASFHRHNAGVSRSGGKFAIALEDCFEGALIGVAVVGNPISATYMGQRIAEVLRVCVLDGSPKGACSMLYSACWRAWRAMGGQKLITYTLPAEGGASLRGAGWRVVGETQPQPEGWRKRDHLAREWQPIMGQQKLRWEVTA